MIVFGREPPQKLLLLCFKDLRQPRQQTLPLGPPHFTRGNIDREGGYIYRQWNIEVAVVNLSPLCRYRRAPLGNSPGPLLKLVSPHHLQVEEVERVDPPDDAMSSRARPVK